MKTRLTKQQIYDYLEEKNLQWGRQDENRIYVWEVGNCCRSETETVLMRAGLMLIEQKFDRVCCKTKNLYLERSIYTVRVLDKATMKVVVEKKTSHENIADDLMKVAIDKFDNNFIKQLLLYNNVIQNVAC